MNNSKITTTRRTAIQQLALVSAGLSMFSLISNGEVKTAVKKNNDKIIEPFYLPPLPPLQPGPGGIDIRTWVRSTQTNKQFSCVEAAVAPKKMGPAPHIHKELDEIMLVLEGTASVIVAGKMEEIQAGGWHMRPRGIEHTFWNGTDKNLRFIDMYFNQNFEDFLEELFHKIIPGMLQNKLTPEDPVVAKQFAELDKKFGITTFAEKRQGIIDKYGLIA